MSQVVLRNLIYSFKTVTQALTTKKLLGVACHPMVVAICLKLVQATTQGTLRQEDRNIKDTKKLKK